MNKPYFAKIPKKEIIRYLENKEKNSYTKMDKLLYSLIEEAREFRDINKKMETFINNVWVCRLC